MENIFLQQFNETIDKWIIYLDDYTSEMLRQQPDPESWSLGQVYTHIINDTRFYVGQMKAALSTKADSEKQMHEYAKAMFRNNGFPDARLENPANAGIRQPENKYELAQSLVSIRNEVNQLCAAADLSRSIGKTEHPGFHFFNALEWLQFAEMHMRHHFRQKKRIDDKLFSQL